MLGLLIIENRKRINAIIEKSSEQILPLLLSHSTVIWEIDGLAVNSEKV
jgi:hypothetical protein